MQTEQLINVAPSSTDGHYVKGAKNVVVLDEVNETFLVEGPSKLVTRDTKHTTLEIDEDTLITCQNVYDPYRQAFEKSRD